VVNRGKIHDDSINHYLEQYGVLFTFCHFFDTASKFKPMNKYNDEEMIEINSDDDAPALITDLQSQGVNNTLDVMGGGISRQMGAKATKLSVARSQSATFKEMLHFQESMAKFLEEQTKPMQIRVLRENYKFFMDCVQAH
jgi:hypothetical protein